MTMSTSRLLHTQQAHPRAKNERAKSSWGLQRREAAREYAKCVLGVVGSQLNWTVYARQASREPFCAKKTSDLHLYSNRQAKRRPRRRRIFVGASIVKIKPGRVARIAPAIDEVDSERRRRELSTWKAGLPLGKSACTD